MKRALDLFCGAGGATKGLQRAGFHVTGVDQKPQPRYCGDEFHWADALTFPLEGYDFIWASPPCQAFSSLRFMYNAKVHPNLIPETRAMLLRNAKPFVIENVEGAPLGDSGYLIVLCGTMFGLRTADGLAELRRHRLFETSFSIPLRPACQHNGVVIGVYGGHGRDRRRVVQVTGHSGGKSKRDGTQQFPLTLRREAMGIQWMTNAELCQAVPPAYSEFIGRQALSYL